MRDYTNLIVYNAWANSRLIEQLKTLPAESFTKELGGSFPSIRLILVHLLEADWIWLNRWKGIPLVQAYPDWLTDDIHSISDAWQPIQEEIKAAVEKLSVQPDQDMQFLTKKGDPCHMSFADTVIHAVNHGTFHRGQLVNMIRLLGEKPAATDYFIFCTI